MSVMQTGIPANCQHMSLPGSHCKITRHKQEAMDAKGLLSALLKPCDLSKASEITENIHSMYSNSRWHSYARRYLCPAGLSHILSHGGGGGASHFLLLWDLPSFSRLRCQCLLTGFTREEKSHCSGNTQKRSKTFLAFFLATDPVTSRHISPGWHHSHGVYLFLPPTGHTALGH